MIEEMQCQERPTPSHCNFSNRTMTKSNYDIRPVKHTKDYLSTLNSWLFVIFKWFGLKLQIGPQPLHIFYEKLNHCPTPRSLF